MSRWMMVRPVVLVLLVVFCCGLALAEVDGNVTSEDDSVEHFKALEKKLKASVGSVIKMVLPTLMRGSSDSDVSGQCAASIMKIIGGIRQLKEWAVRFIDASGKPPAGLLEGTTLSLGDYDECLDIEVGKKEEKPQTPEDVVMKGQYCMLEFHGSDDINRAIADFRDNRDAPIAKTKTFLNLFVKYKHLANATFKMGVCVPSKCSGYDVSSMANSESIRKQIGRISVLYCREKGDEVISIEQKILLSLFAICFGCMLFGTIVDAFLRSKEETKNTKSENISTIRYVIKKSSIYSNAIDLLNTDTAPDHLACFRGLRIIIIGIIAYSHTYANLHKFHFQKFSKAANFLKFFDSFTFAGIGNGSVTLDSLIFIIAVSLSYDIWRYAPKREKAKLNIFRFLLSRYARLSAGQLLAISIFLLFPVFGSGPFWNAYVDPMLHNCQQRWWLNILYISNYWKTGDLCLYHTWIFGLLMQLILIGFLVLWIMKKSLALGILMMVLLTIGGIVGVAVMTAVHDLPGALAFFMLNLRSFPIAWEDVFQMPYDHLGPFCWGLLTGYFLAVKKEHLQISKMTSIVLWCCTIAVASAVVFGLYEYRNGAKMNLTLSIFYAVLHRNVWCMFIAWIVIACTTHHAGPLPRLLKCKAFIPLDRLCFMTYVIHIQIMYYYWGSIRELMYMGHMELMFLAIGYIVVSFTCSFILHVTFVAPYFAIEEYICSFFKTKDKVVIDFKTDLKSISIPSSISALPETVDGANVCVNLGYSKSLERL